MAQRHLTIFRGFSRLFKTDVWVIYVRHTYMR